MHVDELEWVTWLLLCGATSNEALGESWQVAVTAVVTDIKRRRASRHASRFNRRGFGFALFRTVRTSSFGASRA
eukprot:1009226-Prorocentrum_minimum.AAC.1